jgi:CHAT domain-containing protein/tetratricopeptide (TPR) repeat protein
VLHAIRISGVCLIAAAVPHAASDQPDAGAYARCQPGAGQAWSYDHLMCLRRVGLERRQLDAARRRLVALGGGDPSRPWATLVLAHLTLDELRRDEAIALYERAAEAFAQQRDADGEVIARQNLVRQFQLRGDVKTAAGHVALAVAAAEASRQPLIIARAAVIDAAQAIATGGDLGRAHRELVRADHLASAGAPIGLRRTILFNLANASLYLGRAEDALEALDRHRALRAEDGSTQDAATVEFNRLVAEIAIGGRRPGADIRVRLVADAEAVAAEARRLNDPLVEARTHKVLADLAGRFEPERASAHLDRCLELEAALRAPSLRVACLWSRAQLVSAGDPRQAERLSQEALSLISGDRERLLLAFAWQARLRLVWSTLPVEAAIGESFEALDAIERLRASQNEAGGRAALFANWARDYEWLTGQLLEMQPPRVAQAFEVGERLRARVLLERLTQIVPNAPRPERDVTDSHVARRIAATQRQLLESPAGTPERETLLAQLRLLELERADLSAGRLPALSSNAMTFASLDDVQHALDQGEAMFWFSIAPWTDLYGEFGGGSWVLVITRTTATVHRLQTTADLDVQVGALTGMLRSRQTSGEIWTPAARRVGRTLFDDAVARLPSTITRAVVVADGAVHRAPIEALLLETGQSLGERFDVSVVPSATVWLRLRASQADRPAGSVLVVADPAVGNGTPDGLLHLTALPGARREAQSIARMLGAKRQHALEGAAASERALKSAALTTFSIVHFAAHARADSTFPERSAVFLAPGDDHEDGWLQPAEIAALDLRGRVIVLSACDSADGSLVSGEGPLSLARAFFSAGASAVIATRWPLEDDDAAFVMERWYGALRTGQSAAAALRHARREVREAGRPAAAWAGVVLLGDGQVSPLVSRRSDGLLVGRLAAVILAVMMTAAIGGVVWLRNLADRIH